MRRTSGDRSSDRSDVNSATTHNLIGHCKMPSSAVVEPVLDVDDIQGNILAGFNKDHQALLPLTIVEVAGAKLWLRDFHPHIATTREVLQYNRLRKAVKLR